MTVAEGEVPKNGMARTRWYYFLALAGLVAVAATVRLWGITRIGLWGDEYWALYIATGRARALFELPVGTVLTGMPLMGFTNAPHWWHIWMGLGDSSHPPLYHLTLRAWVDLFGQSDWSIRSLSAILGVVAIIFFFDAVRLFRGPWCALLAAVMIAFSPIQIY